MVRNYVRKTSKATAYTKEILNQAIEDVRSGNRTAYSASQTYKIPLSTLSAHMNGIRGKKSKTMGRDTAIPFEDEIILANGLKTMEEWGWGLSRSDVLKIVADYVKHRHLKTPFKNGTPGEDWFLLFAKRHHLSVRKPQSVEYTADAATKSEIVGSNLRKGGIYPFNSSAISSNNYDLRTLKGWEDHQSARNTEQLQVNGPETSKENDVPVTHAELPSVSSEKLLLGTIKQHKGTDVDKSRKRVASDAELITTPEVVKPMEEMMNNLKCERVLKKHRKIIEMKTKKPKMIQLVNLQ